MRTSTAFLAFVSLFVSMPAQAYRVAAWITPWDAASLTSTQLNAGKTTESNPVWYSMNSDGSIAKNWNAENSTWRAAMTGTQLIPTVQNVVAGKFDGLLIANLLASAAFRESHADALTQLAVINAFDGIDIDYESMPSTSRADFTAFITSLSAKLHSANKKLSVTVYAKTSDSQNWNGPGAQDYARLGQLADTVKLMAYDYSWSTSAAGTITPLDWLESVVRYATTAVAPSKVMVGLPWYGYDWQGTVGKGVTYAQAMETARVNNATINRDASGEATYTYGTRTVYFQDAESYRRKVNVITSKFPTVGGFAHWRSGAEDPAIWPIVGGLKSGTVSVGGGGATAPAVDFSISGPSSVSVTGGDTASLAYSLVGINGFVGPVDAAAVISSSFPGTARFTTAQVSSSTPGVLVVAINGNAKSGTHSVKVRFTSGSVVREQTLSVIVTSARKRGA